LEILQVSWKEKKKAEWLMPEMYFPLGYQGNFFWKIWVVVLPDDD
jgi:hypothetical protein